MTRIFIYHEQPTISQRISNVLQGEPDFELIGQSNAVDPEAVAQIHAYLLRAHCDILLVSYTLPNTLAYQMTQLLNNPLAACKVIMLGMVNDKEAILDCLEEGADGYHCEHEGMAELVKKIRCLVDDEIIVDPSIAASLIARISDLKQLVNELDGGNIARPQESYAELTKREWEVLRLLGEEASNQEIAEQLTIELGTVKNHVHNLLRKLDVCGRKQAAQLSRQLFAQAELDEQENSKHENSGKEPSRKISTGVIGWQTSQLTT